MFPSQIALDLVMLSAAKHLLSGRILHRPQNVKSRFFAALPR